MKRESKAYNELESNASMKDENTMPGTEKMKKRPASLNNVNKNITDNA